MSLGLRLAVGFVFVIFGLAFLGTTGVLYHEFKDTNWFDLALLDPENFVFFPIFGVIALVALYLPMCVALDMYWHHVKHGKTIILVAVVASIVGSVFYATLLLTENDAPAPSGPTDANKVSVQEVLWWVTPKALTDDPGSPAGCYKRKDGDKGERQSVFPGASLTCKRIPFLKALENLRTLSKRARPLSRFNRNCNPDLLVQNPAAPAILRYCIVTDRMMTDEDCCGVQKKYWITGINKLAEDRANLSLTGWFHRVVYPVKMFFLFSVLLLGVVLAARGRLLDEKYPDKVWTIDKSVLVAAAAILVWPATNHAFLQAYAALYGVHEGIGGFREIAPYYTLIIGAWALMILFFFLRHFGKTVEKFGKVAGVIGSVVAFAQHDSLINAAVHATGSGATLITVSLLAAMPVVLFLIASGSALSWISFAANNSEAEATLDGTVTKTEITN